MGIPEVWVKERRSKFSLDGWQGSRWRGQRCSGTLGLDCLWEALQQMATGGWGLGQGSGKHRGDREPGIGDREWAEQSGYGQDLWGEASAGGSAKRWAHGHAHTTRTPPPGTCFSTWCRAEKPCCSRTAQCPTTDSPETRNRTPNSHRAP